MNKHKTANKNLPLIVAYLAFCISVLTISSIYMRNLITKSTSNQINNILSLISEKVNTSFYMMTNYLTEAADLVSASENLSYDDMYEGLKKTINDMPYKSVGIIENDGTYHGIPAECEDIKKHGFIDAAQSTDKIYITEPYRSAVTGTNMITMFAPIYSGSRRSGCVFVTYYLETVQNLAYTGILSNETAVFLMNPYSGNFVNCSVDGVNPPGTWGNTRLIKDEITVIGSYNYDSWIEEMCANGKHNIINFSRDGKSYTQAYMKIDGMENWNLVIRIPLAELSDSLHKYTVAMLLFAALLICATLVLAIIVNFKERKQNVTLQELSDHDPLTKVLNRRAFNVRMSDLFADHSQLGRCTFMFFDIDFFKGVNDNHGHDAGDQVLCLTAQALKTTFEGTGYVARIGGDEFNVLIYEPLNVSDIDNMLANLRANLKELTLDNGKKKLPITFSAGLAVYPQDATDLNELTSCADKALYNVKENGRNNHCWYSDIKNDQ